MTAASARRQQRSLSAPPLRMMAETKTDFDIKTYFATMLPKVEAALAESMGTLSQFLIRGACMRDHHTRAAPLRPELGDRMRIYRPDIASVQMCCHASGSTTARRPLCMNPCATLSWPVYCLLYLIRPPAIVCARAHILAEDVPPPVCVHVCVRVCVCACVRACVFVCVCLCAGVLA